MLEPWSRHQKTTRISETGTRTLREASSYLGLASLLLPIDALVNHNDFHLPSNTSSNIVTLFRNMWFLCVLFQFTTPSEQKQRSAMDWQQPALARIAIKTPPLILEEAQDTIVSDLEYNAVIRQEYIDTVWSQSGLYGEGVYYIPLPSSNPFL